MTANGAVAGIGVSRHRRDLALPILFQGTNEIQHPIACFGKQGCRGVQIVASSKRFDAKQELTGGLARNVFGGVLQGMSQTSNGCGVAFIESLFDLRQTQGT